MKTKHLAHGSRKNARRSPAPALWLLALLTMAGVGGGLAAHAGSPAATTVRAADPAAEIDYPALDQLISRLHDEAQAARANRE